MKKHFFYNTNNRFYFVNFINLAVAHSHGGGFLFRVGNGGKNCSSVCFTFATFKNGDTITSFSIHKGFLLKIFKQHTFVNYKGGQA